MNIIGENLKKNRLLNNLSLYEAGNLLNMSAPAIVKYEKGEIVPNSEKLIQFANAYKVKTMDLLCSYSLPEMTFKSFRKRKKLTGKRLDLLKKIIQNEVAKYLEVLELNNSNTLSFKLPTYKCDSLQEAENAAENFRKQIIKISDSLPISDLTNILENMGIIILYVKNSNGMFDDFDGFSEIVNNLPIIILLEGEDGARQRFTLAHELGHLVLNVDETKDEEKFCHRFASSLLMPKTAMVNEFGFSRNKINFYEFIAIKEEYKVSYQAIAYRLNELNIINSYVYQKICKYLSKVIGKNDPNKIKPEESLQFKRIVCKLEATGIISLQKAAELIGVSVYEYNIKYNSNRY